MGVRRSRSRRFFWNDEIIVFHIFSYLPLRSLFRFKCVCKRWATLFLHPIFLYLRQKNSPFSHLLSEDAALLRQLDGDNPDRWRGFTDICCSSHNLVLQQQGDLIPQYRIQCEPTWDVLPIPSPQYPSLCITLEFVPVTSNHLSGGAVKLVSAHQQHDIDDWNKFNLSYELLSLENPSSCPRWRAIPIPSSKYYNSDDIIRLRKRKSIQFFFRMGFAYCICLLQIEDDDDLRIQVDVLDMVNETYTGRTTFPRGAGFDLTMASTTHTHLLDWNGRLSFAQLLKDELHVLVLDDPTKLKWAETKRIIKLQFLKPEVKEELITFHALVNKSTLFFLWQVDKNNLYFCRYDIYSRKLSTLKLDPFSSFCTLTDAEFVPLEVARLALCKAGL